MNFFYFHFMPYLHLDPKIRAQHDSCWMVLPNGAYDPKKGHELYNRYLDELELGEELGYDGLCLNEHHSTAYGMMPAPNLICAALARRTKRIKIAILGNAITLRDHPLMVAEELAMLDNIMGGRLICGFVRGIGVEYLVWGVNPTYSHERFHEAQELIVRAWTATEPFAFEGKHHHVPWVNVWPRPYQEPHPPIWTPTNGSTETVEWAARADHRYKYLQNLSAADACKKYMQLYRDVAARNGWEATPANLAWGCPVYVAETDAIAVQEMKPHIESFYNVFFRNPPHRFLPPGYMSLESMRRLAIDKMAVFGPQTIDNLMKHGIVLCGSAKTVREQLAHNAKEWGFDTHLGAFHFGTLPHELTVKSLRLYAEEVIPYLRNVNKPTAVPNAVHEGATRVAPP
jgi:alkanesulfonate monooxygenase SsuD/methylene tetrahydromethanopterin reductase-like flavin-dependent oxidoreductase (luciferase family)